MTIYIVYENDYEGSFEVIDVYDNEDAAIKHKNFLWSKGGYGQNFDIKDVELKSEFSKE